MSEYDDDPLVRALRSPGTPDELAGEAEALRAYRAAFPAGARGRGRRALGRLGVGGTALALSISLGGGVAAAYTQTLPARVQAFAHGVLGPVGVPPAKAREPRRGPASAAPGGPGTASATTPPTSPSAGSTSPEPDGSTTSAAPGGGTSPHPPPGQPSQPSPTQPTQPSSTTAPTGAPSSTPPSPSESPTSGSSATPEAVSIETSATVVEPGATVTVGGTVTDAAGAPLAQRTVRLLVRTADGPWATYATTRSDTEGAVELTTATLTETLYARLVVRGNLTSETVRVDLQPTITATMPASGGTVDVTVVGGQPGDTVTIVQVSREGRREVGRGRLSATGTVSVPVPATTGRVAHVARLLATPRHLTASVRAGASTPRETTPPPSPSPEQPEQPADPGPTTPDPTPTDQPAPGPAATTAADPVTGWRSRPEAQSLAMSPAAESVTAEPAEPAGRGGAVPR